MKKCLICGTGDKSGFTYGEINKDYCQVIAMIDDNPDIRGMYWDGIFEIISPADINNYQYDYIVFSDVEYERAFQQCLELGIKREKLIPFWEDSHDVVFENRSKRIELLENILRLREANAPYEYGNAKKQKCDRGRNYFVRLLMITVRSQDLGMVNLR